MFGLGIDKNLFIPEEVFLLISLSKATNKSNLCFACFKIYHLYFSFFFSNFSGEASWVIK